MGRFLITGCGPIIGLALAAPLSALVAFSSFLEHGLDQGHHELRAVGHCYRDIRDARLVRFSDCSAYAQSHLKFFGVTDERQAASGVCIVRTISNHLYGDQIIREESQDRGPLSVIKADCEHPQADRVLIYKVLIDHKVPFAAWPFTLSDQKT